MGYYDSLDLSGDLQLMWGDNAGHLDTGILKVEGQTDVTLTNCILDEPVDTHEMEPAAGQVPQMDVLKIWPAKFSVKPPLGSALVDSQGTYWTILAVRYKNMVQTYECHCRNLSIITAPINKTVVLRAVYGKGRANEARAEWHGLFSGKRPATHQDVIPARFQPAGEEAMIRFSGDWTREAYRVILDKKLPLELAGGEYRLENETGERFRILRYFDEQRIDRLPVCFAVKIVEGVEYWRKGTPPTELPAPEFPTQP